MTQTQGHVRETTPAERIAAVAGERVLRVEGEDLRTLCDRWGVPMHDFEAPEPLRALDLGEMPLDAASVHELACAQGVRVDLAGQIPDGYGQTISRVDPEDLPDGEVGQVGTPLYSGIIGIEPTARLTPYLARGFAGSAGVYEEHLREPLVYKTIQSIREVVVTGEWGLATPADCPEEMREPVEALCTAIWHALQTIPGGWDTYVEHALSAIAFGFSIFEIVWGQVDGVTLPVKLAFREPSSVERWLLDERARELMAVEFQTGGDQSISYALPVKGEQLTHRRVLLNTLAGRGLNFEGLPPTRTIDTLITKKKLLLTIQAACAERFGAPILAARVDGQVIGMLKDLGLQPTQDEWDDFFDVLRYLLAVDTPTMQVPTGLMAEYVGPGGTAPDFQAQLEYIDSQIMLAFSAQGSLLGQQSAHGSYALAETADSDFMRSAPYYARFATRSLNELIRHIFAANGVQLPSYPRIQWRLAGAHDTTRWMDDLVKLMGVKDQLPAALLEMALEKLGAPPDAFDALEEDEPDVLDPDAEDADLEEDEPVLIPDAPLALAEEADPFDPGRESGKLDAAEDAIATRFSALGRKLRARWKELIRDNDSAADVLADRERLEREFRPLYRAAVEEVMKDLGGEAARSVLAELGLRGDPGVELTDELTLLAASVGDEAYNRTAGVMTDAEVDRERGDTRQTVPVLAGATLALIAARAVSSAYNAGRTQAVEAVKEAVAQRGQSLRVLAERSSVLDERTCGPCRDLDGERAVVGSRRYRAISPPNRCDGRHRCRCVWRYELPPGVDVEDLMEVLG